MIQEYFKLIILDVSYHLYKKNIFVLFKKTVIVFNILFIYIYFIIF